MLNYYVKLLKDNTIKVTTQRLDILKYLKEHSTHPTADNIYCALKKKHPSLSKTTVYNSLETLKKHKLIQSITISESELRYDIDHGLHHHFLCRECGNILDIAIECPNIKRITAEGYQVEEVHGYFKGICINCLKKGRKKSG